MMDDTDIYHSATALIKRYGEDAASEALTRADEMLGQGDDDGWFVWMRIMSAVKELEAENPEGTVH